MNGSHGSAYEIKPPEPPRPPGWAQSMKRDAVAIAFPDWTWETDDVADVRCTWDPGHNYSTYTFEDPRWTILVMVEHAGMDRVHRYYFGDEAQQFFLDLMARGSYS